MMLSFDIAEFNCGDGSRIGLFQQYLKDYLYHAAAAKINGKSAVTTFMGQDCSFGQGSTNNGWNTVFGANAGNIYFMPAYTSDPRGLGAFNIQAEVNWGSAWPEGGNDVNLDRENYFISLLSPSGKEYVPTISPLFASHMSYKVSPMMYSRGVKLLMIELYLAGR
jgi:glucan endo-1,3-alpha-glucosidase